MLPKINRLRKKKDFETVFKKGTGHKGPCFILRVLKNSLDYSRLGIVVSKKVSKKAVERNKVRRRASEAIRHNFIGIKKGFDIIFIVLPAAKKEDYNGIEKIIIDLLSKAKCLNP